MPTNPQPKRGPNTPEGKARSSQNALKHGLTSRRSLLADEDPKAFAAHAKALQDHFQPLDPFESFLVDEIVVATWRILRVRRAEAGALREAYPEGVPASQDDQQQQALNATISMEALQHIHR